MGEQNTTKILEDFKEAFQLEFEELREIAKFEPNNPEKLKRITRKMDTIQKVAKETLPPWGRREWLFGDNKILKESPFDALGKGYLDKVIEVVLDLRDNII